MNTSSTTSILYRNTTTKTIAMSYPFQEEHFSVPQWFPVTSLGGVTFYSQRSNFVPRPLWEHMYPQNYFFFLEQVNATRYERHVHMRAGDFNTFNFGHFVYEVNNGNQGQNVAAPTDAAPPNQPLQSNIIPQAAPVAAVPRQSAQEYTMAPFATVNPADLVLSSARPAPPAAIPAAVNNAGPPARPEFIREGGHYTCSDCNKKYTSGDGMVYHWESAHEGVKYKCSVCDKILSRYYGMISHIKEEHGGDGKPVKGQW